MLTLSALLTQLGTTTALRFDASGTLDCFGLLDRLGRVLMPLCPTATGRTTATAAATTAASFLGGLLRLTRLRLFQLRRHEDRSEVVDLWLVLRHRRNDGCILVFVEFIAGFY